MQQRAVLFDLDGTLTDPGTGIGNSVSHALATLGMPTLSAAQLRAFVGPPLQDSFGALGLSPADVDRAVVAYRSYFTDRGIYENVVYDGIPELLQDLRDHGVRLAVATSKPTVFAQRIVEHFELSAYFDVVIGSELDGSRRHKHQVIEEVLARLAPPEDGGAVMVGDRAQDVVGATRAGLPCIGVTWGYADDGELAAVGAVCLVDTPEALRHVLSTRWSALLGSRTSPTIGPVP